MFNVKLALLLVVSSIFVNATAVNAQTIRKVQSPQTNTPKLFCKVKGFQQGYCLTFPKLFKVSTILVETEYQVPTNPDPPLLN
jgi:hypothetical protein